MRWTLRYMLLAMAGVGCCIVGVTTFGIAATTSSIVILGAVWFVNSRMAVARRGWSTWVTLVGVAAVLLYVGTFLAFRVFRTFEFSLAHADDPQRNVVIFSLNPTTQDLARQVYYPLITWIPGHCAYPTGEEMELLNHDPFTDEPITRYW